MPRLGCLCPRSRVPEVAREAGRGPLALPGISPETLRGSRDFSRRVILRPGFLDPLLPTGTRFLCLLTCQCRPHHPRPSSCLHRVKPSLTFGLRSVPSSFGDQTYFGKFRGTGSSVRDDQFLFPFLGVIFSKCSIGKTLITSSPAVVEWSLPAYSRVIGRGGGDI